MVDIMHDADVARCMIRERVAREKAERRRVVMQKFPRKVQRPRVVGPIGHRGEPDLPVEVRLVRRDELRRALHVPRLRDVRVILPIGGRGIVAVGALENDDVALASDRAECAVGVDEMQWVVGCVHRLVGRKQVQHGHDA